MTWACSIVLTQRNRPKGIDFEWTVGHFFQRYAFFNSFPLEKDFFFAKFEWNPECTTESNQMNSSNTVSIQGLRPDVADLKFEDLVNAKPDLAVLRLSDGTVSENLR